MKKIKKSSFEFRHFVCLHIIIFLFSFTAVFSKLAAAQDFLSGWFILFYALSISVLFIYALAWQQIIKHIPLTTAFCNKGVGIIWGMLWGFLFFQETVSWNMILGAAIVICGVIMVVKADD